MMRRHLAAWAGLLALWPANAAEQHVRWHPPLTVGSTVLAHNRSSINCAAPVDMQHLTELASSAANYTELTAAASRYILHLVAPVVHNCTYISLMQPSLWLPMSPPGAPTMTDAWPPDSPLRSELQVNSTAAVAGGTPAEIEAARARRAAVWTQHTQRLPRQQRARVALLYVQDDARKLRHYLGVYAALLVCNLYYADAHGYDVLLYTRSKPMPHRMSSMFVKLPGAYGALFGLGTDLVLGIDWDNWADPRAAVPLQPFTTGWRRAGLFVQGVSELIAGTLLYRRRGCTRQLLHRWWELGLTGKYNERFHDQSALLRLFKEHLWGLTGDKLFADWVNRTMPSNRVPPNFYAHHGDVLREQSIFGVVGLREKYDKREVALQSCGGRLAQCIPNDAAGVMQHYGHARYTEPRGVNRTGPEVYEAVMHWREMVLGVEGD